MKVSDGDLAEEGLDLAAEHGDRALNRAREGSTVSVELRVAVAAPATFSEISPVAAFCCSTEAATAEV